MSKRKNINLPDSFFLNNCTFDSYYIRLRLLALSVFEWVNVPNGIDTEYLERTLFDKGKIVFFKDNIYNLGYLALSCTYDGASLNAYGKPNSVTPVSVNYPSIVLHPRDYVGLDQKLHKQNCVVIKNNNMRYPTDEFATLYAARLYEIERSIDVNVKNQKFPVLITGPEKAKLSMENVYNQFDGNRPVIFGHDVLKDYVDIKALNLNYPFVADKLQIHLKKKFDEYLSLIGVHTANTDKKERLVSDEVNAYDEYANLSAESFYMCRKEACDKINELFNLEPKMDVKFRNKSNNIANEINDSLRGDDYE